MGDDDLLGIAELAALLGLSKAAVCARALRPDFPVPTRLASGPIWTYGAVRRYCQTRSESLVERPGIVAVAEEPYVVRRPVETATPESEWAPESPGSSLPGGSGRLSLEEAAETLGTTVAQLRDAIERNPTLPVVRSYDGTVHGVLASSLGIFARLLASRGWREYA